MPGARTDWLVGGGEMAKLIKAKDWSRTPLGSMARWPQSLRTTVSLVQASNSPISLAWGAGHTQIYNDGYWPICGAKHPGAMGQDFRECWASTFSVLGEAYAAGWSGRSAHLEKMRMFLDRFGFLEEAWFTFSFSPITDESGGVGGVFHPVTELTGQMLSERRTRTLRDLAIRAGVGRTTAEAMQLAALVLAEDNLDVPFAVLYAVDEAGTQARRIAQAGISPAAAGPELVGLGPGRSPWSIAEAFRSNAVAELDDVRARVSEAVGPYPELPRHAFVLPVHQVGLATPVALVVVGVSARLRVTDAYRVFFELVAGAVGIAIASARTLEAEHHKAEALAELDRAKTAFFSNVSHELRTPLTLILGPLEDELAERDARLPPERRARLDAAHRNALRLLRLVNTLLDFSRIEAGRLQVTYAPVDLVAETLHLAGGFRAAIERAGLTLTLDRTPLPEPIFVDREMWEKIVLNLLSNALNHTPTGGIFVALRWHGDHVALEVRDTGIGIAAAELPHLFERFRRVTGAWSRSHAGTGIGLALVHDLAGMLGGGVAVASTEGVGTTFTVTIKTGSAHLPADQVHERVAPAGTVAPAFVQDALEWLPGTPAGRPAGDRPRVVWADDNADMRAYVTGLLVDQFDVVAVADGQAALDEVRAQLPDLVLSDVMMPRLDGFGLLAALRADPETRTLPVILVSARAGAESSVEGIDAGADDYLIKPFVARELIARVRTHVALNHARRQWAEQLERDNKELEAFSYSVSHDLRAPLRAIDGFCRILLADYAPVLDAEGVDHLQQIHGAARRMAAIVDDLLVLSKVSQAELRKKPVDVTAIARRVVADLRLRAPAREVDVRVADGLVAVGDDRMVAIVLENLLANAWKFTGKRNDAKIRVGQEDGGVVFVRDNGAGFDMAHAEHLFEPFQRLHTDAEFEGTGIGLAIVRRIVDRHGGRAWAHGAVGDGATVRFTLGAGAASVEHARLR